MLAEELDEMEMHVGGDRLRSELECSSLPLAVYREVAAHLRQVAGVEVGLLPQRSPQFDYYQSQIGGLWIEYVSPHSEIAQAQVQKILDYYGDRFGQWQAIKGD